MSGGASLAAHAARRATAEDVTAVAETLAAAFHDDPVLSWCHPDPDRRRAVLPRSFAIIAAANVPHGGVYTTDGALGAAVWVPPGVEEDEASGAELLELAGPDAPRLVEVFRLMGEHHPTDPHHYLFLLGTRPEHQSRGVGSALMRPVLEACDREGLPAYLEATSQRNLALYQRHGFAVTTEIPLPDGPSLWAMWREPR
jgi:ribosomal protein S18 acetylase RimI-like enzyme